jgi:preprotein translocase subunit YajC
MFQLLVLLAEGEQQPKAGEGLYSMLLPLGLVFLMYFFFLRPMRRQDQERKALLQGLKKNDEVLTTSGIYGTVVAISDDKDEITVRVADNVRLRMLKGSIARNLTNEEAAKAPKEGAA